MSCHPVDIHVGSRLKFRRTQYGISQRELGEKVGLTFQQIQKYELGANRISASRLYEFSRILHCTPNWFFEGLEGFGEASLKSTLDQREVSHLLRNYYVLSPIQRRQFVSFMKICGGSGG